MSPPPAGRRDPLREILDALETALREQAKQGSAEAQLQLGYRYAQGDRVPRDDREAFSWFRKAAEQGHPQAQHCVAVSYFKGQGVGRDVRQAYFWMFLASARDPDWAGLADYFAGSDLTPAQRDEIRAEARAWTPEPDGEREAVVRERAERGDAEAQLKLGAWYAEGARVAKDESEAFSWFRRAAEQGHPGAQFTVGWMLFTGQGIAIDERQAYFWLVLASERDPDCEAIRDAVGSELTPGQRSEAHADARAWAPKSA